MPYCTKKGNKHLQEQQVDNLTIFQEYSTDDTENATNIGYILSVLYEFYVTSGLDIN